MVSASAPPLLRSSPKAATTPGALPAVIVLKVANVLPGVLAKALDGVHVVPPVGRKTRTCLSFHVVAAMPVMVVPPSVPAADFQQTDMRPREPPTDPAVTACVQPEGVTAVGTTPPFMA